MNEFQLLSQFTQGYDPGQALASPRVLLSIVIAAVLGVILGYLYRGYYRGSEPFERSVGRSFVLLTPAITMIFNLLQFSLPLSLGLLGALSFVRFRTPIKRAEDIAFIMVMIGIGLSCAVGYYVGGVLLLVVVGLVSVLRAHAPQALGFAAPTVPLLTVRSPEVVDFDALAQVLALYGQPAIVSTQQTEDWHQLVLTLRGHHEARNTELLRKVAETAGDGLRLDVYFPDNQLAE